MNKILLFLAVVLFGAATCIALGWIAVAKEGGTWVTPLGPTCLAGAMFFGDPK